LIKTYSGPHNHEVLDLAVAIDNGKFVSVGGDKLVFLWDVTTGKLIRKFQGHTARINCVDWNSDCSVLVSGSYDSTIRFWDYRSISHNEIQVCKNFKDSVSKVIVDDTSVITSSMDGCIRTFDIRAGEIVVDDLAQPIHSMDLSHDKKCVIASCTDNKIRMFERSSGDTLNEYVSHKAESYSIGCKFIWDDSHIISGSEDGVIYIYDILQSKAILRLKNHLRPVSSIDMSPLRNSFLSGSHDGTCTFWAQPVG